MRARAPVGPGDAVYRADLATLASRLSRADMTTVMTAYLFVPICERLRLTVAEGHRLEGGDLSNMEAAEQRFSETMGVLRPRGYGGKGLTPLQ